VSEALLASTAGDRVASKAWLRALELTGRIHKNSERILPLVIEEVALKSSAAPALLSVDECLTYGELARQSNRYSRWALAQGLAKGDTICLFMPNRPEYLAIWLGITRVGGVVSLLNTNLIGLSLAHCINIVQPAHIIVDADLVDSLTVALRALERPVQLWVPGADFDKYPSEPLSDEEQRIVTIHDRALCIYTSGTTGLPKAANISHFRLMQWSHWFAGMMGTTPADRMYNCLPMYHSVGGVVATGAVLVSAGSVVIREKFSATEFWEDITRWDCTLFQYIGELCRYLLHTPPCPQETKHRLRICCGNGLSGDVWNEFKTRFRIPDIVEFYAATEGNFSLFNLEGKPGSIGRVPSFLAHRFPVTLVRFDFEKQAPIRNDEGFCVRCGRDEVGEAISKIAADSAQPGGRFEGYTSAEATERKILRNVFQSGDAWFRTGDLMRKDEKGFFYFVDRIGDTFRWKGENVATSEVSDVIRAFPGIREANAYGIAVPGTDGRACMAALVTDTELDLEALRAYLVERLP
jgi:fatty-acyl-CoA synthase